MAQNNLISLERALYNLPNAPTDATTQRIIDAMIGAASEAIAKYCKRDFILRSYDELYNGNGDRRLLLRQYPIVSVESCRYRPVTVMYVQNTNQALNQQARVQVTSTGIQCWRMASGVAVLETLLLYTTYPTMTAMANAITALGNGWAAQIVGDSGSLYGDYGLWPSSDLWIIPSFGTGATSQGALNCRGANAELKMHTYELQGYQWDARGWLLRAIPYTDPELLHPEDLVWPVGINNFRIQYTAGYATIPEAVQEATAEWVSAMYFATQRDPALVSQTIPGSIAQNWGSGGGSDGSSNREPPANVCRLLQPYRRYSVGINQG
jgi:hypothetical protein